MNLQVCLLTQFFMVASAGSFLRSRSFVFVHSLFYFSFFLFISLTCAVAFLCPLLVARAKTSSLVSYRTLFVEYKRRTKQFKSERGICCGDKRTMHSRTRCFLPTANSCPFRGLFRSRMLPDAFINFHTINLCCTKPRL